MKSIFILPLFVLVINPAYAKMNKCKSPEGKLFYSQFACPDSHSKMQHDIKDENPSVKYARMKLVEQRASEARYERKTQIAERRAEAEIIREKSKAEVANAKANLYNTISNIKNERFRRASQTYCPSWKTRDSLGVCK